MAYEVVMSYHLHMPSYFLGTFTEYPCLKRASGARLNTIFEEQTTGFPFCRILITLSASPAIPRYTSPSQFHIQPALMPAMLPGDRY